ncbi:NAD(P)-dependent glycerol-3-phosphate dehydrogenase [bacterium]|nr:NAD(P)-dependent glycerol-3-phosphate dehydrogenase [bacterium]
MCSRHKHEVGIIGAGAWGTTIAAHLSRNGHPSLIWALEPEVVNEINTDHKNSIFLKDIELPESLTATGKLYDFENIDWLIIVVPSAYFADVTGKLQGHVKMETPIVSATKGFISSDLMRPTEHLERLFPDNSIGALSGPNLSREVVMGLPAISLVASSDDNLVKEFQHILSSDRFRVYGGNDMTGTELGGALKNIIAIAAGMVDGLKLGENSLAALITRGLAEMIKLGGRLGAETRTFFGVSGLGDLVCTSQSTLSRNHEVGRRVASGEKLDVILASRPSVAEGVVTTKHVQEFSSMHDLDMPITNAVYTVLFEDRDPKHAVYELMTRSLKME